MITIVPAYELRKSILLARDSPARNPTRHMLRDIGMRIIPAIKNINIATSKAIILISSVALGKRILTDCVMADPCKINPIEKPLAPSMTPNLLLIILEPTAGPTQADKLLPETNAIAMKVKTTRRIENSSIRVT